MQDNDPNRNQGHALRQAAAAGDLAAIRQLLASGANVALLDNAALRWAVRHRQTSAARMLLEASAPLEPYADEFLNMAAQNGDGHTLALLLAYLPPGHESDMLSQLLLLAVNSHNVHAAATLIAAGADPRTKDNEALLAAGCGGDVPMLKLLRQHGADIRARSSQVLFNGVFAHSPRAVKYLLQAGVDTQAQAGVPLQLAILNGDAEIVEILLAAGLPMTAPEWVVDCVGSDSVQTLQLLVHHGSNLLTFANDLVRKAADKAAPRILAYVLEHAQVSQPSLDYGLEPAVRAACGRVVRLLLDAGDNPKTNTSAAFRVAIESGELGLARWLLQGGASVTDLTATAVTDVLSTGDVTFLIELLRARLNVDGANLVPFLATLFCQRVGPAELLRDSSGTLHPEPICLARMRFARMVSSKAGEHPCTEIAMPIIWLAEVMAEHGPWSNTNNHH
jgi:ankyrin repeat protein